MTETETKQDQAKAGRPDHKNKNQGYLHRTELQVLLEDLGIVEYTPGQNWEDNTSRITIKVYSPQLYPRLFQILEMIYRPDQIELSICEDDKHYYYIDIKAPILLLSKYISEEDSHE